MKKWLLNIAPKQVALEPLVQIFHGAFEHGGRRHIAAVEEAVIKPNRCSFGEPAVHQVKKLV